MSISIIISDISDVLVRLRHHRIALADLEKAFLIVGVAEPDWDALRLLWVDDPTSEAPKIVVKRFSRVVFGVTSSPFLLNWTIKHHVSYESEDPQFVNEFLNTSMWTILMCERSVTLRRLNAIRRQNVEWGMEDFTCGSGFQIHGNWLRGVIRKEFLLQSAKLAEEDQTYATS